MKMYEVVYSKQYLNSIKKLDKQVIKSITKWIETHLLDTTDPYFSGKRLTGKLGNYWRYRIGDYRLIVEIRETELVIVAIDIGHRREIYK